VVAKSRGTGHGEDLRFIGLFGSRLAAFHRKQFREMMEIWRIVETLS